MKLVVWYYVDSLISTTSQLGLGNFGDFILPYYLMFRVCIFSSFYVETPFTHISFTIS